VRAARFHRAGEVIIDEVARPDEIPPGEVLLRVRTAGICGSDALEYRAGPVLIHPLDAPHPVTGHVGPLTLGHEFAGEVVSVGPGTEGIEEGMLVACGAGMSCGTCELCRQGRTHLCERYATIGFHRDGGLAEFCLAPASICYDAAAYGLTPDAASLAQPMAIAVHAARRGRITEREVAVVIGAGGIGCFLTYVAAQAGATVIVSDLDDERLRIASALGASEAFRAGGDDSLAEFLAASGIDVDVTFEVSGAASALEQAVALTRRGGRIVPVGVQKSMPAIDMRRITLDEMELIGTVAHAARDDFPEALKLISSRSSGWAEVAPEVLSLDLLVADGLRPLAEGRSERIKTLTDPSLHGGRRAAETRPTHGR
jgi:(R,R)-butanediol dehydrogenase/meso-butanediol dehydrogenase/diacetyl reductase